ncbi:MAG: RloB family protein [Roseiflexus sp.]
MARQLARSERRHGRRRRIVGQRVIRQSFLIVGESEKTEPNYFRVFQVPGLVVHIRSTTNRGLGLIDAAVQLRERDEYDQVRCVFDCDDLPSDSVRRMFQFAQQERINLAFSNRAFELWYLLHFAYHNTALPRQDYVTLLNRYLGHYSKNTTSMYAFLLDRQATAIANAHRLYKQYNPWDPATADPSTTVHRLVEELNKHRRP